MPQAKHGDKGVEAVAVAGSKLEGTGLVNEHIGQTQVALIGFGAGCLYGVAGSGHCELPDWSVGDCDAEGLAPTLFDLRSFFAGFGCKRIFEDDFRNPA
jgi:hypothetical protein